MKNLIYILLLICGLTVATDVNAQTLQQILTDWVDNYERWDVKTRKPNLKSCVINHEERNVTVTFGGGFSEQFFTPEVTDSLYNRVKSLLTQDVKDYSLEIMTEDHRIEDLIPNFFRNKEIDASRLWKNNYDGNPWVMNISRPYRADAGLEGCHVSLWQSHGKYFKIDRREEKTGWTWQRPRLFCTCEDLFTQTFVVPYIIPMLENAGAVVFTPRERDWQKHEVIVDNDYPQRGGSYQEFYSSDNVPDKWNSVIGGFSDYKDIYMTVDSPFCAGTARTIPAVQNSGSESTVLWTPRIPEEGKYAVYVSYQSGTQNIPDAHYTVYHKGGMTEFRVNQKMGGSTWVYLGTFDFAAGQSNMGCITLSNLSDHRGMVNADAVRFGGGMSNIVVVDSVSGNAYMSDLPRWAEGAKYSAIWYGMPYSTRDEKFVNDDYKNDIACRSAIINYLSGGSVYNPQTENGKNVPLEVNVAFHSDAGYRLEQEFLGSLGIYMTNDNEGLTGAGLDRYTSRDLASMLLTNLARDLKSYEWTVRNLWNRDYGEARDPKIPACILEMLSHQNFYDIRLGYDPKFKFEMCRSIYKTIVKYVATMHSRPYVIQPLPITDFRTTLNTRERMAHLSWRGVNDPLEPSATPTSYVVYCKTDDNGFDNGTVVTGTSCNVPIKDGRVYSFKVTALNQGGESFPSEILSVGMARENKGTTLVVNGFTRLEGPKAVLSDSQQGFDLDADPGIQYGRFAGFCGRQKAFDTAKAGSEEEDGLGFSGEELVGQVIMGNTFDYSGIHGKALLAAGHSFVSMSESAFMTYFNNGSEIVPDYPFLDIYFGVQTSVNSTTSRLVEGYLQHGGKAIISGSNIGTYVINDKSIDSVSGCGLTFDVWREMNEKSYPVPSITVMEPKGQDFAILAYENGYAAAIASSKKQKYIKMGFPLESVKDKNKMTALVNAFMSFLRQ